MSDEGRALLTEREREVLSGEADVTDNYRYKVQSVVRGRIRKNLGDDLQFLKENFPEAHQIAVREVTGRPYQIDAGAAQAILETALLATEGEEPNVSLARDQLEEALGVIRDGESWPTSADIGGRSVGEGDRFRANEEIQAPAGTIDGGDCLEVDSLIGSVGEEPRGVFLTRVGERGGVYLRSAQLADAFDGEQIEPEPDGG